MGKSDTTEESPLFDDGHIFLGHESYGSQSLKCRFMQKYCDGIATLETIDESRRLTSVTQLFKSIFLPQGYPESVSSDYGTYQIWDSLQAFASSITGALATHAVLQGVGVGDESATVLAATFTWLLKSGSGMIGQIVFAWLKGTYLDCDCKRWRLFADILNDFAIFLEILAPMFNTYFRYVVCSAGVCKAIVGVSGGASRAALTQHQARRNNMADVSAKDGSQETLVNLVALLTSLVLIPLIADKPLIVWVLFTLFTTLHLYANYSAVRAVQMETFNQTRLFYAVKFFASKEYQMVPSVPYVNSQEPVVFPLKRTNTIKLGASLHGSIKNLHDFTFLIRLFRSNGYLLQVDLKKYVTYIILHHGATLEDQLRACFQAEIIELALSRSPILNNSIDKLTCELRDAAIGGDKYSIISSSLEITENTFPVFLKCIVAEGWNTSKLLLGADEWRASWATPDPTNPKDTNLHSMNVFNPQRFHLAAQEFIKSNEDHTLSVEKASQMELEAEERNFNVRLGTDSMEVFEKMEAMGVTNHPKYITMVNWHRGMIRICLKKDFTPTDVKQKLEAFLFAEALEYIDLVASQNTIISENRNSNIIQAIDIVLEDISHTKCKEYPNGKFNDDGLVSCVNKYVEEKFPKFLNLIEQAGWKTDIDQLGFDSHHLSQSFDLDIELHEQFDASNMFNQARLHLVVQAYLASDHKKILSVSEANPRKPYRYKIVRRLQFLPAKGNIFTENEMKMFRINCIDSKYILKIDFKKGMCHISLNGSALVHDVIKCFFHAELMEFISGYLNNENLEINNIGLKEIIEAAQNRNMKKLYQLSYQYTESHCPPLLIKASKLHCWNIEQILIDPEAWKLPEENPKAQALTSLYDDWD